MHVLETQPPHAAAALGEPPAPDRIDPANMDFVRVVGAIWVVAMHILQFQNIKTIGVFDVGMLGMGCLSGFFMHSMCALLMSVDRMRGHAPLGAFLVKRAFRLLPLAWLSIAVVVALRIPSIKVSEGALQLWEVSPTRLLANLLMVQDVFRIDSAIGSLWPLPSELWICLLVPFIWRLLHRAKHPTWVALGLWASSVALAIAQVILEVERLEMLQLLPLFFAGTLAYGFAAKPRRRIPWGWLPVTYTALALLSGALPAVLIIWVGTFAFAFILPRFRGPSAPAARAALGKLARLTYGVYLWQLPVLALTVQLPQALPLALRWILFACVLMATSILTYRFVEVPGLSLGRRLSERLASGRKRVPVVSTGGVS